MTPHEKTILDTIKIGSRVICRFRLDGRRPHRGTIDRIVNPGVSFIVKMDSHQYPKSGMTIFSNELEILKEK